MSLLQEPARGLVLSQAGTESRGTSCVPNKGEVWGLQGKLYGVGAQGAPVLPEGLVGGRKYHDEKGHSVLGGLTQKHGEEAPGTTSQRK